MGGYYVSTRRQHFWQAFTTNHNVINSHIRTSVPA